MLSGSHTNVSELFRKFPKIAEEDPKMFRLNIDKLCLIQQLNMANAASWLVENDITGVDIIFIHTCDNHSYRFATTRYSTAVYIITTGL